MYTHSIVVFLFSMSMILLLMAIAHFTSDTGLYFTGKCLDCIHTHMQTLISYCICDLRALCAAVRVLEATLLDNVAKKQECVKLLDCP